MLDGVVVTFCSSPQDRRQAARIGERLRKHIFLSVFIIDGVHVRERKARQKSGQRGVLLGNFFWREGLEVAFGPKPMGERGGR